MSTYRVAGMKCGGCAVSVEQALTEALPGAEVAVDLEAGRVHIQPPHAFPPGEEAARVEAAIEEIGFVYGGPA